MAKIPGLDSQGQDVATPAPQVQANANDFGAGVDQAIQGAGAQGQAIAGEQINEQNRITDDLNRTNAAVAYQTHETNVKQAMQDLGGQLNSGAIDQVDYVAGVNDAKQQSFDSTIGALPDNHYKNIATVQSQGLNRSVDLGTQQVITKNSQQQIAANAGTMLDTASKAISIDPTTIDSTVASATQGYLSAAKIAGIPLPEATKQATTWANSQYASAATNAAIIARNNGDLPTLDKLATDLTAPDGAYAGKMTPEQNNRVLATVVSQRMALANQQQSQDNAREAAAQTAYNQGVGVFNEGKQFSPDYMRQLQTATAGTSMEAATQNLFKQVAANASFTTLPVQAQRAQIQKDQQDANTPGVGTDPVTAAAEKQRQTVYNASVEAYKKDPWNAALDRGAITQIPPLDTSSIPNLMTSLQQRAAMTPLIEQQAGRPVSLMTPEESSKVLTTLTALGPDAQVQMLNGIGAAYGNAGRIGDLASQWHESKPGIALALKMSAAGGDGGPLMTASGNPVSKYVLMGQQALADKTVKVDDTAATGVQAQIANQLNNIGLPPAQLADAKEAAYYAAIGNAANKGSQNVASNDVAAGLDLAVGGISKTAGPAINNKPQMVARPYGWTDDDFQGALKSATTANIENQQPDGTPVDTVFANGKPIPADAFMKQFPSYQLSRVGVRGTYAIQAGSKFVTDKTGAPITVQLHRATAAPAVASTAPAQAMDASTAFDPSTAQ